MNRNIPRRTWNLIAVLAGLWFGVDVYGQDENRVDDQLLPTGRSISPAGKSLEFSGRPVDLAIGENGKLLFVKDRNHLRIFLDRSVSRGAFGFIAGWCLVVRNLRRKGVDGLCDQCE